METPETQAGDAIVDEGSAADLPFGPPETPAQPAAQQPPAEAPPAEGQPPAEQSPEWIAAMNERFQELRQDLGIVSLPPTPQTPDAQARADAQAGPGIAESLFPAAPEQQQQPGEPGEEGFDEFGYPQDQQQAEQQLREYLQSEIDSRVQEQLNPFFESQMRDQRVNAALALEAEFPELRNPEIAQPVVQMAQGLMAEMGMPEAANHPGIAQVVRLIYMASKADARASSETPAGQQTDGEVALETPGARVPGSQQAAQPDDGDLIVAAGQGAKLPFMT